MDSANVEIVRAISLPWKDGDFSAPPVWADPEIVWVIADGPAPGAWHGVDGMLRGWRDFLSAWKDWRAVAEEFRELDAERVLVLFHFTGSGRGSGLGVGQIRTHGATLYHLRDDKVTRLVLYWDRERAFTDLGLRG